MVVGMNSRSDECVARLMIDILAEFRLLSGQKDAWYYRQMDLENWVCAGVCNCDTVHVQMSVPIIVCPGDKLR